MYTVKNMGGVCKAVKIESGSETVICSEGQRVTAGPNTYTVGKENNKCSIFLVKKENIGGNVVETLDKICEEGQFL